MRIEKGEAHARYDYWTVQVDPGELVTDSGKPLPYGTWIGTFKRDGTINVWTPAASVPRGYKAAATRMLRDAADKWLAEHPSHWCYGSGSAGCLYDHQGTAETRDDAIEAGLFIFDALPARELQRARAALKTAGIYYFNAKYRADAGADYVEISEQDGPCPDNDD